MGRVAADASDDEFRTRQTSATTSDAAITPSTMGQRMRETVVGGCVGADSATIAAGAGVRTDVGEAADVASDDDRCSAFSFATTAAAADDVGAASSHRSAAERASLAALPR